MIILANKIEKTVDQIDYPVGRSGLPFSKSHGELFVFCAPILFFLFLEKEKNSRGVRRSQLHSVAAGAAKTPYPQPSSFPNCDRFTGSQFGHLEFYNAARDLDDGGQAACYGYGNTMNPHKKRAASWPLLYFRFHVLGQKRTSIG